MNGVYKMFEGWCAGGAARVKERPLVRESVGVGGGELSADVVYMRREERGD